MNPPPPDLPPGWALRPAGQGDITAVATLERESFDPPWSAASLRGELAHEAALLHVVGPADGPPVAYAAWRRAADEAELNRLAVTASARRQGLASHLVRVGESELARHGVILCHLEVRSDNRAARAFYRALGYQLVGRRRRYYPGGGDALLFSRRLGDALSSG